MLGRFVVFPWSQNRLSENLKPRTPTSINQATVEIRGQTKVYNDRASLGSNLREFRSYKLITFFLMIFYLVGRFAVFSAAVFLISVNRWR